VLALYFGLASISFWLVPVCGILGAMLSLFLLFVLAGRSASIATLILAGVAINALAGALTALALNLAPNPFASIEMMFWLLGSVADRSLAQIAFCLPFLVLGSVLLFSAARSLSALSLGETSAVSLGVNLASLQRRVLLGTGLAVGAAVATVGNIGFVGLVVPHLLRPWVRHDPSRLLLPSMLGGGILLLLADMAVRMMPIGSELKLGVLTALIGAPFFVLMILSLAQRVRL
jgi:iron complex transport system permease protein